MKEYAYMLKAILGQGGLDQFLESVEQEVYHLQHLVQPDESSVERLNTAPKNGGTSAIVKTMPLRKKMRVLPVMRNTLRIVDKCSKYMRDDMPTENASAPPALMDDIRQLAHEHGASDIALVEIPPTEIFKGRAAPYNHALVFTMEMDKDAISTAPSHDALIEVLSTYGVLGQVALKLTEFLRAEGYGAYPGFPVGGLVDYVRLAEQAGLGAIGYHGMLISPQEGTRLRLNVVYTNIDNLTETEQNPHFWVRDFCAMCRKCIRDCPPQAIYDDGEIDSNGRKKTVEYDKCLDYFGNNQGCAVCVKTCPFSQAGYDVIQTRFIGGPTQMTD